MTANELAYQQLQESIRHNEATEVAADRQALASLIGANAKQQEADVKSVAEARTTIDYIIKFLEAVIPG